MEAYKQAFEKQPGNAKYAAAYTHMRFFVAAQHVHRGQLLKQSGNYTDALSEFRRAREIDPTNYIAEQEIKITSEVIRDPKSAASAASRLESPLAKMAAESEGPIELRPTSKSPLTLRMSAESDNLYKTIGRLAGINVVFDPDYKPQKISVELNDVTLRQALGLLGMQSKTFWRAVSPNTIYVASDTPAKRKEIESLVMKTFYLRNVSAPNELQEAASALKGILEISHIQLIPTQNALVLRGTPDQMILSEKLLADIDKPKAEVVIDIAVLQVRRDRVRTLGVNPPTSASVAIQPNGANTLTLQTLSNLNAGNFAVAIPPATLTFLLNDTATQVLQNPQVRALDSEKATLKIGDRVPIATGSFQPGAGGSGINPLVNTQFQYLDVGVNIDIVPRIHSNTEVTLRMSLEVSAVTGSQNIGGINQPVIGQRRIEHETRLRNGDVNLVGGILEKSETQSLNGYPFLSKIPVLKYLFAQEDKQQRENEIVFAIVPHIIRAQEIDEQNLRMIDIGTGTSVGVRRRDAVSDTPARPPTPAAVQPESQTSSDPAPPYF